METLRWILLGLGLVLVIGIYLYSRMDRAPRKLRRRENTSDPYYTDDGSEVGVVRVIPDDEYAQRETTTPVPPSPSPLLRGKSKKPDAVIDDAIVAERHAQLKAATQKTPIDVTKAAQTPETIDIFATAKKPQAKKSPTAEPAQQAQNKVVLLYIAGRPGERVGGSQIRAAVLGEGLILNAHGFFERRDASRQHLYQIANMVQPGRFSADNFESITTPGLTVFLTIPGPRDPVAAFDDMVNTARRVAKRIGVLVLDENRELLRDKKVQSLRDDIAAFRRSLRLIEI